MRLLIETFANQFRRNVRNVRPLIALAVVAVVIGVYFNGLFGGFLFDDYHNIVNNRALALIDGTAERWQALAFSNYSGLLQRPVSMLTFGINHYLFGMNPIAFKAVNLGVHLLCGLSLFILVKAIHGNLTPYNKNINGPNYPQVVAAIVSVCWLLHPLNVSDVIYIVQRMNQLSTLFILIGLNCYVAGRSRMLQSRPYGLLLASSGLIAFGALAIFSKENGALIVAYALVIEAVCFRFKSSDQRLSTSIVALFIGVLALPAVGTLAYTLANPNWLIDGYAVRDFTLQERLLTQPRILLHYVQWIFFPAPSLMGLYHDDILLSRSLLNPPSTLAAIAAIIIALYLSWKMRNKLPGITFAIAWFLAGHSMESTILPLEMAFEHRNYLPMAGVILGITVSLSSATIVIQNKIRTSIVIIIVLAFLASATANRTYDWRSPISLALEHAANHPQSPRSQYEAGRAIAIAASEGEEVAKESAKWEARKYFLKTMGIDRNNIHASVAYILTFYGTNTLIHQEIIEDLLFRLKEAPSFDATPVVNLFEHLSLETILIPPRDVKRLFESSLDNPNIAASQRARILNSYGQYCFKVLNDPQRAISLTLAASHENPTNPIFHINLSKIAIAVQQLHFAHQHLAMASELDRDRLYTVDIDSLKNKISSRDDRQD